MSHSTMGRLRRSLAIAIPAALLLASPPAARAAQDRPGGQDQPKAAEASPTVTIYLSPGAVRQVQAALQSAGFAPDRTDGVWGDGSTTALEKFQSAKGLDPSGHPNLMTLVALGLPPLLDGAPAADGTPLSKEAIDGGGTPLYLSPAAVRRIQMGLEAKQAAAKRTTIPGNILGVWHTSSERAAGEFQKAQGLAQTGAADLELIHALGLDAILDHPGPANVLMLTDAQAPFGGVEVQAGPALVQVIRQALDKHGAKAGGADRHWTAEATAAVKAFQQAQGLAATGHLDLETLRALGFAHPLTDLAQAAPQS